MREEKRTISRSIVEELPVDGWTEVWRGVCFDFVSRARLRCGKQSEEISSARPRYEIKTPNLQHTTYHIVVLYTVALAVALASI